LMLLFRFSGITERAENMLIDFRHQYFNPNHKFSDKIILIDFDEDTFKKLGNKKEFGRWPWKRSAYTPILEYLSLGAPKMVLFDIMFFERSEESQDIALGDISDRLTQMGIPVSHAASFRYEEKTNAKPEDIPEDMRAALDTISMKFPSESDSILRKYNIFSYPTDDIMRKIRHLHSVSYKSDVDGVSRRIEPFFKYEKLHLPALPFKGFDAVKPMDQIDISEKSLNLRSGDENTNIPLENGRMRLHYYSPEQMENIPRFPVWSLIESYEKVKKGEADPANLETNFFDFQNRIIIIGTSAAATFDDKVTPYGKMPGFVLHAVVLSNLLEKHFLKLSPLWFNVLLLVITIPTCVFFSFFFQQMALRVFVPAGIFLGYTLLALFAFKFDIHLPLASFLTAYPLAFLGSLGYLSFTEGAERRKYSKVLSNMVDPSIVSEALNDLEALKKGGEREITAFFSDVAGFSTISEQLSSADLAALLNEYLSAMTIILKHNHGTLDKYIGDAVVGIFGAPIHRDEHFIEAAKASLEMIEKLKELKAYWSANNLYCKDAQDMDVRIGLNTGLAKVGFMGTDALASYTMMGDTVNLAARLEAAGKDYGVNILISEFTNDKIKEQMFTRKLDRVRVKGKNEPVQLFELIAIKGQESESRRESAQIYEEAFGLYLKQEWDKAIELFEKSQKARGSKDKAAEMLMDRCIYYKNSPPGVEWDGVFTRKHK
ncbi:MAG TPA: adenylate/guanylate cyclase domain-containing protein, partial [Leptospiraceae bacterium]|nr:adenylate/guanylate cyclase domain-containing protein [Leptospiraceae bacterium]